VFPGELWVSYNVYGVCHRDYPRAVRVVVVYTTQVREIRHYGQSDAKEIPPGQGNGYVWPVYGFVGFEERDGGVYFELERLSLSRDILFAVRWVVDPIVRGISMLISLRRPKRLSVPEQERRKNPALPRAVQGSRVRVCYSPPATLTLRRQWAPASTVPICERTRRPARCSLAGWEAT
jgi:hypothetical protein